MELKIGVDLDGVVANFTRGRVELLSEVLDWDGTEEECQTWDFLPQTPFARWQDFWEWAQENHIFRNLPVYPGAVDGVRKLVGLGEVTFITSRPHWAKQDTTAWMKDHELFMPVIFDVSKWARRMNLYVEDSPFQLRDLRSFHREAKVIRMVRPWNSPVEGCVDARDWNEVVAKATRMVKGE